MKKTFTGFVLAVLALALVGLTVPTAHAADPDVSIVRVRYNANGPDTADNRWKEVVYLRARADLAEPLDIGGWRIHDTYKNADGEWGNVYTFPAGTTVKPGGAVAVTSAAGVDKTNPNEPQGYHMDFRRGYNGHWLNNGGDIVYLDKADGTNVDSYDYDFDSGYYV